MPTPSYHSCENGNPVGNQSPQATRYKVSRWDKVFYWIPTCVGMVRCVRGRTEVRPLQDTQNRPETSRNRP